MSPDSLNSINSTILADQHLLDGIKSVADSAKTLQGWGLTVIGGSIIAFISTSYIKPVTLKERLFYLFFIPGWTLIGISMYYGDRISRRLIAALFAKDHDVFTSIKFQLSPDFNHQIIYFRWGLICFGIWLFCYLFWWLIFESKKPIKNENTFEETEL